MQKLGDYRIIKLLGRGQFGETFKAVKDGLTVALKVIKEEAVQAGFDIRYFQKEVKALQKAIGPNVIRFIDSGTAKLGEEMRYFVVMEYLEGDDLAKTFDKVGHTFPENTLKNILIQVVSGLECIHDKNIIHRDLKPANIFLEKNGVVKLLDFGLVKMLDYTTIATRAGQPVGTPLYMAPEILRGDKIDYRADFYSLGVLTYYLVTSGNYPIRAATPIELYMKLVNNPPMRPTHYNKNISHEFENLILTLLGKQPYERINNHQDIINAVKSIPITIPFKKTILTKTYRKKFAKKCYFRLLNNEKSVIESFVQSGGKMDGFVFPANFLPMYQNSLVAFQKLKLAYLFDPATCRLPYSSFALTKGLRNLPYVPDKENILTPDMLGTLKGLQEYARGCIDWQLKWDCSTLVAPFHYSQNSSSRWLETDIKLIEESISYAKEKDSSLSVFAGVCTNIEHLTVEDNRLDLLNRYSRVNADGYLFYVDNLNERTTNPLQITSYLKLLTLFQKLGKPVYACRIGTLGLGLLSAGIDGITSGIASLSSFSESDLLEDRATGYNMKSKYYIPSMLLTIPVEMAKDILSDTRNGHMRCTCKYCKGNTQNISVAAKQHFLEIRTQEISQINSFKSTEERLSWFSKKVEVAIRNCKSVYDQRLVKLTPSHYSHLKIWLQVFSPKKKGST